MKLFVISAYLHKGGGGEQTPGLNYLKWGIPEFKRTKKECTQGEQNHFDPRKTLHYYLSNYIFCEKLNKNNYLVRENIAFICL